MLHFDSKAIIESYIRALNIPATFLYMSAFSSFPLQSLIPLSTNSRTYKLSYPVPPTTLFPIISPTSDTGKYITAILSKRSSLLGKQIYAAERSYTLTELVDIMRERGIDVIYEQCDEAAFRKRMAGVGFPDIFQDGVTDSFKWFAEFGCFGKETEQLIEEGHRYANRA